MAYVQPTSIIKLYSNIPLDNSYRDTLYFANITAQNTFFHTSTSPIYILTNNSYVRAANNKIRANVLCDDIYTCNYIAFKNASHSSKWFYAFVTKLEYLNEQTTEITYEIDYIQTYLFDIDIPTCFVVREHSVTDNIGDNTLPEPVGCSYYVHKEIDRAIGNYFTDYTSNICVAYSLNKVLDIFHVVGQMSGKKYSGVLYEFAQTTPGGIEYINTLLTQFLHYELNEDDQWRPNGIQNVLSVFMCPTFLNSEHTVDDDMVYPYILISNVFNFTPKNKKLYTSPYCYLEAFSTDGNSENYAFERFGSTDQTMLWSSFRRITRLDLGVSMGCFPLVYNGDCDVNKAIFVNNFPQCSYNSDRFFENLLNIGLGLIGSSVESLTNVSNTQPAQVEGETDASFQARVMANNISQNGTEPTNKALSTAQTVLPPISSVATATVKNAMTSVSHHANDRHDLIYEHDGTADVIFYLNKPNEYEAQMIDDYFTRYGYACNRLKKPNISSRPQFNYVLTHDCDIHGNAPTEALDTISSCFNRGITFWKNASNVGDYSVDNSPVSTTNNGGDNNGEE